MRCHFWSPGCWTTLFSCCSSSAVSSSMKNPAPESIVFATLAQVAPEGRQIIYEWNSCNFKCWMCCAVSKHMPSIAEDGLLASLACLSINARCLFRSILANMCGVKDTLDSCEEFTQSAGASWEWLASGTSMISLHTIPVWKKY